MAHCYDYPRPMVTVDILVFHPNAEVPREILLIKRGNPPYEGQWAFPGGFCDMDETLEKAAVRELKEETTVEQPQVQQFKTISTVDRDPRGRTITTAFIASIDKNNVEISGEDDASEARWFTLDDLPELAFDHGEILASYLQQKQNDNF